MSNNDNITIGNLAHLSYRSLDQTYKLIAGHRYFGRDMQYGIYGLGITKTENYIELIETLFRVGLDYFFPENNRQQGKSRVESELIHALGDFSTFKRILTQDRAIVDHHLPFAATTLDTLYRFQEEVNKAIYRVSKLYYRKDAIQESFYGTGVYPGFYLGHILDLGVPLRSPHSPIGLSGKSRVERNNVPLNEQLKYYQTYIHGINKTPVFFRDRLVARSHHRDIHHEHYYQEGSDHARNKTDKGDPVTITNSTMDRYFSSFGTPTNYELFSYHALQHEIPLLHWQPPATHPSVIILHPYNGYRGLGANYADTLPLKITSDATGQIIKFYPTQNMLAERLNTINRQGNHYFFEIRNDFVINYLQKYHPSLKNRRNNTEVTVDLRNKTLANLFPNPSQRTGITELETFKSSYLPVTRIGRFASSDGVYYYRLYYPQRTHLHAHCVGILFGKRQRSHRLYTDIYKSNTQPGQKSYRYDNKYDNLPIATSVEADLFNFHVTSRSDFENRGQINIVVNKPIYRQFVVPYVYGMEGLGGDNRETFMTSLFAIEANNADIHIEINAPIEIVARFEDIIPDAPYYKSTNFSLDHRNPASVLFHLFHIYGNGNNLVVTFNQSVRFGVRKRSLTRGIDKRYIDVNSLICTTDSDLKHELHYGSNAIVIDADGELPNYMIGVNGADAYTYGRFTIDRYHLPLPFFTIEDTTLETFKQLPLRQKSNEQENIKQAILWELNQRRLSDIGMYKSIPEGMFIRTYIEEMDPPIFFKKSKNAVDTHDEAYEIIHKFAHLMQRDLDNPDRTLTVNELHEILDHYQQSVSRGDAWKPLRLARFSGNNVDGIHIDLHSFPLIKPNTLSTTLPDHADGWRIKTVTNSRTPLGDRQFSFFQPDDYFIYIINNSVDSPWSRYNYKGSYRVPSNLQPTHTLVQYLEMTGIMELGYYRIITRSDNRNHLQICLGSNSDKTPDAIHDRYQRTKPVTYRYLRSSRLTSEDVTRDKAHASNVLRDYPGKEVTYEHYVELVREIVGPAVNMDLVHVIALYLREQTVYQIPLAEVTDFILGLAWLGSLPSDHVMDGNGYYSHRSHERANFQRFLDKKHDPSGNYPTAISSFQSYIMAPMIKPNCEAELIDNLRNTLRSETHLLSTKNQANRHLISVSDLMDHKTKMTNLVNSTNFDRLKRSFNALFSDPNLANEKFFENIRFITVHEYCMLKLSGKLDSRYPSVLYLPLLSLSYRLYRENPVITTETKPNYFDDEAMFNGIFVHVEDYDPMRCRFFIRQHAEQSNSPYCRGEYIGGEGWIPCGGWDSPPAYQDEYTKIYLPRNKKFYVVSYHTRYIHESVNDVLHQIRPEVTGLVHHDKIETALKRAANVKRAEINQLDPLRNGFATTAFEYGKLINHQYVDIQRPTWLSHHSRRYPSQQYDEDTINLFAQDINYYANKAIEPNYNARGDGKEISYGVLKSVVKNTNFNASARIALHHALNPGRAYVYHNHLQRMVFSEKPQSRFSEYPAVNFMIPLYNQENAMPTDKIEQITKVIDTIYYYVPNIQVMRPHVQYERDLRHVTDHLIDAYVYFDNNRHKGFMLARENYVKRYIDQLSWYRRKINRLASSDVGFRFIDEWLTGRTNPPKINVTVESPPSPTIGRDGASGGTATPSPTPRQPSTPPAPPAPPKVTELGHFRLGYLRDWTDNANQTPYRFKLYETNGSITNFPRNGYRYTIEIRKGDQNGTIWVSERDFTYRDSNSIIASLRLAYHTSRMTAIVKEYRNSDRALIRKSISTSVDDETPPPLGAYRMGYVLGEDVESGNAPHQFKIYPTNGFAAYPRSGHRYTIQLFKNSKTGSVWLPETEFTPDRTNPIVLPDKTVPVWTGTTWVRIREYQRDGNILIRDTWTNNVRNETPPFELEDAYYIEYTRSDEPGYDRHQRYHYTIVRKGNGLRNVPRSGHYYKIEMMQHSKDGENVYSERSITLNSSQRIRIEDNITTLYNTTWALISEYRSSDNKLTRKYWTRDYRDITPPEPVRTPSPPPRPAIPAINPNDFIIEKLGWSSFSTFTGTDWSYYFRIKRPDGSYLPDETTYRVRMIGFTPNGFITIASPDRNYQQFSTYENLASLLLSSMPYSPDPKPVSGTMEVIVNGISKRISISANERWTV